VRRQMQLRVGDCVRRRSPNSCRDEHSTSKPQSDCVELTRSIASAEHSRCVTLYCHPSSPLKSRNDISRGGSGRPAEHLTMPNQPSHSIPAYTIYPYNQPTPPSLDTLLYKVHHILAQIYYPTAKYACIHPPSHPASPRTRGLARVTTRAVRPREIPAPGPVGGTRPQWHPS
jgi:hypothetical protein